MFKSKDPCFKCGKKEKTVEVKLKEPVFQGTLCLDCLYGYLPDKKPKKEVQGANRQKSGGTPVGQS